MTSSQCPPWACSKKTSTVPSFSKQSGPRLRKALRGELPGFRREEGKTWTYRDVLPFPTAPNTPGATAVALGVLENVVISHRLVGEGGPSCFLLFTAHIAQKIKLQSPKLPKTLHQHDARSPPRRGASVGILGVESHFNSLDLVAQLDGGPQLQLHALLHGGEGQQQERLPINVLPGNKAPLEPRHWAPREGICHRWLHPGGQGHAMLPFLPSIQESAIRHTDLAWGHSFWLIKSVCSENSGYSEIHTPRLVGTKRWNR